MAETDPERLAEDLERQTDDLERRGDELGQRTKDAAQDWERKRSDPSVPGALPPEGEEGEARSPGPEAPPEEAGPSQAEMAPEGQAGPPADGAGGDESG